MIENRFTLCQNGAMVAPDRISTFVRTLDRINLRLAPSLFRSIDAACRRRPGNISRNTWITEAIQEKLARDGILVEPFRQTGKPSA